jgi:hypothetical protein
VAAFDGVWHGPDMRSLPARVALALTVVVSSFVDMGCGSTTKPMARMRPRIVKTSAETVVPPTPTSTQPPMLPAHVVGRFDDEESVPYVARRGDDMLLVFNAKGKLFSRLLGIDGAPKSDNIELGVSVGDVTNAAIAPVGDAWIVAWVACF